MKTIKEAGEEYAKKEGYCVIDQCGEKAFSAAVEFAQRYIPIEEELPLIEEDKIFSEHLLLKFKNGLELTGFYYEGVGGGYFAIDNSDAIEQSQIAGWRPINLK